MVRIPRTDPIEYLVRRKYPAYIAYQAPEPLEGGRSGPSFEDRREYLAKAKAYQMQLQELPSEELEKRYAEEKQKELEELAAKRAAEEDRRFFNAPYSKADFTHWAKAAYWTLEEAIALAFGKSPEAVSWKKLESYKNVSPFVAEYAKVRDLAIRAKNWNQLYDPVYPGFFLAWAKRNDIGIPEELEELAVKYGQNIGDWKTAYDNLKENFDTLKAQFEDLIDSTRENSAEIGEKIAALAEERDALLGQVAELEASGKPLNPKERESVLRLIIGMAIKGYSYDPSVSRSPIAREIADDLAETGLPLSEDTVRKWLKEAAEILPGKRGLE